MYVIINAARLLSVEELSHVDELAAAAARGGSEIAAATFALVRATTAMRSGSTANAAKFGVDAAARYAVLGWPLLEASALELAGHRAQALDIYRRCGAVAEVRRLGEASVPAKVHSLSAREMEVAALVARGLRNAEIAKQLSIGKKTVEKHLSSLFDKLGLRSRAQVVAFIAASQERHQH
jgi:DNA-binding NarL/FixJ family response regulator